MFVCKGIFQAAILFSIQSLSIGLHNGEIQDGERDALLLEGKSGCKQASERWV